MQLHMLKDKLVSVLNKSGMKREWQNEIKVAQINFEHSKKKKTLCGKTFKHTTTKLMKTILKGGQQLCKKMVTVKMGK